MKSANEQFVPALGVKFLTPLYDPVVRLTSRELAFKTELLRQAEVKDSERVLDVGCGTGTLALAVKQANPGALVSGIDADGAMLSRAEGKARDSLLEVAFERALSNDLPYPAETFNVVLSSLFFHHLTREAKRKTFEEMLRCLVGGGRIHVADWGGARSWVDRVCFLPVRILDGFETTADNISGHLPELMTEAGFAEVSETRRVRTPLGIISLYRARKPSPDNQGG